MFLIAISLLLLASIFGTSRALALPVWIVERTTVLDYEHKGEFDYLAYQKASYLFGDIPLETEDTSPGNPVAPIIPGSQQAAPKYPIESVDRFDFTFSYKLVPGQEPTIGRVSAQVEVKTVLPKSGGGTAEVFLVPSTSQTGDFTLEFSLPGSTLAESTATTITANVYATMQTDTVPIFERFTQSLTIRSDEPLFEMDSNLTSTRRASYGKFTYQQIGEFDYRVHFRPDSPWGAITLRPLEPPPPLPALSEPLPPPPPLPSAEILGPDDTIFISLFNSLEMEFSYHLESSEPVRQMTGEAEIYAVLENPGVWKKTFPLVPLIKEGGDFSVTFSLDTDDLNHFRKVFTTIQKETGVSVPANLMIKVDVHTVAQTDVGTIDEVFSQTLTTALGGDTLQWKEELVAYQPGTIEIPTTIINPDKYLGLSVGAVRRLSVLMPGALFIWLLGMVVLNLWFKPEGPSATAKVEEQALRTRKKHKGVIVDVEDLPAARTLEVIPLSSIDQLVRAADLLLKPVLHKGETGRHTYWVVDGVTCYQYLLTVNKDQPGSNG